MLHLVCLIQLKIAAELNTKLIQTSRLLAFCAHFTVSLSVALYKFLEPNKGFTFKTKRHLHDRSDLTAVGPTNTALYCTWVTHWFHEAGLNTTAVGAAGQDLANKSAVSSGHRHAETSRSVITTISIILNNKEEPTGYIIVES